MVLQLHHGVSHGGVPGRFDFENPIAREGYRDERPGDRPVVTTAARSPAVLVRHARVDIGPGYLVVLVVYQRGVRRRVVFARPAAVVRRCSCGAVCRCGC